MTKKVENKRVHEEVITPVNEQKITSFLTNVNYLNTADADTEKANVKALSKCNDIVQDFKGWNAQNLTTKYQKLCNDSGIFFKAKKGICLHEKSGVKLGKTASTIVSACKRFINDNQIIDDKTTYSSIKEHFKKKQPKLSDVRKAQNKRVLALSDKLITKMLKLYDDNQKSQNTVDNVIQTKVTKNKKVKGKMAGALV
jgi:hypothetical protein